MLRISSGDLDDPRVVNLLRDHVSSARAQTAPGSAHALDLAALRTRGIRVFTVWDGEVALGVGALKHLSADHGEVRSMFVAPSMRGRGAGGALLRHIIASAKASGMSRLSLETGTWEYFRFARALYRNHGFQECSPFSDYVLDPNSVFMSLDLGGPNSNEGIVSMFVSTEGARAHIDPEIDAMVGVFYAAFDNRASRAPTLDALRALFSESATITRVTHDRVDTWTLDAFISPRAALLSDGTLTEFHEWETQAHTVVLENIASRWSTYAKEGKRDGADLRGSGQKFIQFLRTEQRWFINAILWEDS